MKYETLVTTQYLENYGGHSENGKFSDGNAYWKFKGGSQYLVATKSPQVANAVAFMSAYLHDHNSNRFEKELVTDWATWKKVDLPEDVIRIDVEDYFAAGSDKPIQRAR